MTLNLPDVFEFSERLRLAVPAWIEGEDFLLRHPLKQTNLAKRTRKTRK